MCQAIVKPAGVDIQKSVLKLAWQANQDGAGLCYVNEKQDALIIKKGFFKFKHFWHMYEKHKHKSLLIHFRWGTHGEKTVENCHPFMLAKDAALIHNGVLSGFTPPLNSQLSDTRVFCDGYLAPGMHLSQLSSHDYLSSQALRGFVEAIIGVQNKLAVMTTKGVVIFNEAQGEWFEGAWYSAGYPQETSLDRYNRLWYTAQNTGIQGEDTWLDDMMCEEPARPLSGELTWGKPVDESPYNDYDSEEDEEDGLCIFCYQDSARMYKIDGQGVCGGCFNHYAA